MQERYDWTPPSREHFAYFDVHTIYVRDGWRLTAYTADGRREAVYPATGAADTLTRRAAELGRACTVRGPADNGTGHVLGVTLSVVDRLHLDRLIYGMEEDAESPRTRRWALQRAAELWAGDSDEGFSTAAQTAAAVAERPGPVVTVTVEELDDLALILEHAADYWSCNNYASDTTAHDDHVLGRLADACFSHDGPSLMDVFLPG